MKKLVVLFAVAALSAFGLAACGGDDDDDGGGDTTAASTTTETGGGVVVKCRGSLRRQSSSEPA